MKGSTSSARGHQLGNPVLGLLTTLRLLVTGRVRFRTGSVGLILETTEDGRRFRVFRHAVVRRPQRPSPQALLVVRFTPARMTVQQNIRFSRAPMLVFMGFPGFRSKLWCVDDATGECQGVYEWDTRADADAYAASIAMRFMVRRSVPGSVSFSIVERDGATSWPFTLSPNS